jgi:hypothetical protein
VISHPYRSAPLRPPRRSEKPGDDLAEPVLVSVIWLSSAARFLLAFRHGEPLGAQPALALAITALVPFLIARAWLRRRARSSRDS